MSTQPRTDADYVDDIRRELRFARVLSEPVVASGWLVVSNVAIFVLAWAYGFRLVDGFGFSPERLSGLLMVVYTGMKVNAAVDVGQWWRLPASMWVHLHFMHVIFNVYGLWVLGPMIEKFYGARRFFLLYLITGLAGALASYQFNEMSSGGASGALYGLVGALLVIGVRNRDALPAQVVRGFTTWMLPWLVLSIGVGFSDRVPFDNSAHLAGIFSGMALGLVFRTKLQGRGSPMAERLLRVGTVVGLSMLLLVAWFWSVEATSCLGSADAYLACYPELASELVD